MSITPAITRADQHTPSGLDDVRWCVEDDVLRVINGVAEGDDGEALGAWLSSSDRTEIIEELINVRRETVTQMAGRDFDLHSAVTIRVDGEDRAQLDVGKLGFLPVTSVDSITVIGSSISSYSFDLDDVVLFQDGRIGTSVDYRWPYGQQNIEVVLSWGYSSAPGDVVLSQSMLVASDLLERIQMVDTNDLGSLGGFDGMNWDGFRAIVGAQGRYGKTLKSLRTDAERILLRYRRPGVYGPSPIPLQTLAEDHVIIWESG